VGLEAQDPAVQAEAHQEAAPALDQAGLAQDRSVRAATS